MKKNLSILIVCASLLMVSNVFSNVVYCVHGFMGTKWDMTFLKMNLRQHEFELLDFSYKSRDSFIQRHGAKLAEELVIQSEKKPGQPIDFVTHSMGGLVLLSALNHPLCPDEAKTGRVVLLAPPYNGSAWARTLKQFGFIEKITKSYSGAELLNNENFEHLGTFPSTLDGILVIAGNLGFNPFIDGENDGTVGVSETVLDVPHKHIVVHRGHQSILLSKKVHRLTRRFLEQPMKN